MHFAYEIEVAKKLAVAAGREILKIYARDFSFKEKENDMGPVTEADLASDTLISEGLKQAFPEDFICSEEQADSLDRLKANRIWCIDPLDGTKEFLLKNGEFAVQIGLILERTPVLGVLYMPVSETLYFGGPELGAFKEIQGHSTPLVTGRNFSLQSMRVAASRSHRSEKYLALMKFLKPASEIIHGSVGCKAALISEDKADYFIYLGSGTKEWDICAPEAILRGAGGEITDLSGTRLSYNKSDLFNKTGIIATNGRNHGGLVEAVSLFLKEKS